MIEIGVTNESTVLTDAAVQAALRAIQAQDDNDLAPLWGLEPCELVFLPKGLAPAKGQWQMVIADNSDQAGALGYHETTVNGDPIGYVFAKDDLDSGTSWTVTWSHEHCEMRIDPDIQTVEEQDTADGIVFRAKEVCDPCEDDKWGYHRHDPEKPDGEMFALPDGTEITLSDFVTPAYFNPNAPPGAQLDYCNYIKTPLSILDGGYIGMLVAKGVSWTQATALLDEAARAKTEAHDWMTRGGKPAPALSRRARRLTADGVWKHSSR